ncbi:MAG: hypothetical protein LBF42_01680 [Puniceicoccales bacterium]|jgi:hypothetical protein|nr:hypothetical protein [Puniceicoccales bacterium]
MASWIEITVDDLYDYLVAPQIDVLRKRVLAPGQDDPIGDIICDITARVRAEISGNQRNLLSANKLEIPQNLKSAACYLILECAQTRIPALKLTSDQVRLADDAREYLRRISQGEVPVELPDQVESPSLFNPNKGVSIATSRERIATGNSLRGF